MGKSMVNQLSLGHVYPFIPQTMASLPVAAFIDDEN